MNKSTSIDEGRAGFCSFTACVDPAAAGDQHASRRSPVDDWRVALHEGGHVVVGRALGEEVGGVTIVKGPIMAV
jgi:hypothetical protein